jgi:glycosyltransferase involved in cell wall biosynthesis
MKVLALTPVPAEGAATRFRLMQLRALLAERDIQVTIRPFMDSKTFVGLYQRSALPRTIVGLAGAAVRRLGDVWRARRYDALLVMREAMIFGPPIVEWAAAHAGRCPLVLDLDDATYVAYDSPTYGRLARWLKWPGKTNKLIDMATAVTCGNRVVAEYVERRGGRTWLVPTVVDLELFTPRVNQERPRVPVVGWIGSHSTFPYLQSLAPVLQELALEEQFRLKIVGSGGAEGSFPGVDVEYAPWELDREVADFQSIDIGLYPLSGGSWSSGKSGLKAIQYMAVGVPYVASPIGAAGEIGEEGTTHFAARTSTEWHQALRRLLADSRLRNQMGLAGREHVVQHYPLDRVADVLARAFMEAVGASRG